MTDLDVVFNRLEALYKTHGICARWTCWTQGYEGAAFVMTDKGWTGRAAPWKKSAEEAIRDALLLAEELVVMLEMQKAEKKNSLRNL